MNVGPISTSLIAKLFRGFADESRLGILESLRKGPLSVGEIVAATGLSQPNVSSHLACLKDCGLVDRRQSGRSVIYSLSDERLLAILSLAEDLVASHAESIFACTRYGSEFPSGAIPSRSALEDHERIELPTLLSC